MYVDGLECVKTNGVKYAIVTERSGRTEEQSFREKRTLHESRNARYVRSIRIVPE